MANDVRGMPLRDFLAFLGFTRMQKGAHLADGTKLPPRPPVSINGMEHGTLDPVYCAWVRPLEQADTGLDPMGVYLFIYQTDDRDNVAAFQLHQCMARGVVKNGLLLLDSQFEGGEE